jgi:hypothetical protein
VNATQGASLIAFDVAADGSADNQRELPDLYERLVPTTDSRRSTSCCTCSDTSVLISCSPTSRRSTSRACTGATSCARGVETAARFAVEAETGVSFGMGLTEYEGTPTSRGMHGHDPDRPEMQASLLWLAPGGAPQACVRGTQLVDIAPTVARWLGLTLEGADGRPLD